MAAPEYVPNSLAQQPRRGLQLPPARSWRPDRPGDLGPVHPVGPQLGRPGPDQGYALSLAHRFTDRLVLDDHDDRGDAVAGCLGVALKRASLFGRAPVPHDLEVAFLLWGFLGDAPAELVALRRPLFAECSQHYDDRRAIADHVPDSTLRLTLAQVRERWPARWRELLGLG